MSRADRTMLAEACRQVRVDILRSTAEAGSGHPTSSLSAVELLTVLVARHMRYDIDDPGRPDNDRFVLSKGHATPLLYATLRAVGAIDEEELLTYRTAGSRLEGHPTPRLPWVDAATGSLGQGLPIAVGMALGARLEGSARRTFVLCGDSEMAEGSVWEAVEHAGANRLGGLVALVDVNRLGQRGPTRHEWNLDAYATRLEAFGWATFLLDGHDLEAVDEALAAAIAADRPAALVARTVKGKGVPQVEDEPGFHGVALDMSDEVIADLGGVSDLLIEMQAPPGDRPTRDRGQSLPEAPHWDRGQEIATRDAYGAAILALGRAREDVVVLDGEVSNSTRADAFASEIPDRYVEAYIAEQNMVGMAVGMARTGWRPYASSFSAFLSRAYDFIRMAPVSQADVTFVGSHAGVSIGPDGPSQMGLEDLAIMRAVAGATVLYPCDANQTASLTFALADQPGVSYLRTTRGATPVVYEPGEDFPIGGSRVLREHGQEDRIVIVAAGITVHEAEAAADDLGVPVTVIDAYSVQPLDAATITSAASRCGAVLVVEDHRPAGGLGEAVAAAVLRAGVVCRFEHLAVTGVPGSATPSEQLRLAGLDRTAISEAVRRLVDI